MLAMRQRAQKNQADHPRAGLRRDWCSWLGGNFGGAEKWSDPGCILEVDPIGFPDNSDRGYGVGNQPRVMSKFVSATGNMETPFIYRNVGEADLQEVRSPVLDIFEMSAGDWGGAWNHQHVHDI